MEFHQVIRLKSGKECILQNGSEQDGSDLLSIFLLTHEQTDYLASYPDESTMTEEDEAAFLKEKTLSPDEIEILARVDGKVVASAGIWRIGKKDKVRHRAEFGISVSKDYWGLGIGTAMIEYLSELAREAGYEQLELGVIEGNDRAKALYEKCGFAEMGKQVDAVRYDDGTYADEFLMIRKLAGQK